MLSKLVYCLDKILFHPEIVNISEKWKSLIKFIRFSAYCYECFTKFDSSNFTENFTSFCLITLLYTLSKYFQFKFSSIKVVVNEKIKLFTFSTR